MSVLHVFMQCQSASNHSHIEIKRLSVNRRNCTAGTPGDRPRPREDTRETGCIPREDTRDAFGEEGGVSVTVSEHQQRTVGVYLRTPIIPEYLFISI